MPKLNSGTKFIDVLNQSAIPNAITKWITDASGNVTYIGWAAPGTQDSWPAWKIQKITNPTDPGEGETFISRENQVWDDRATIDYDR